MAWPFLGPVPCGLPRHSFARPVVTRDVSRTYEKRVPKYDTLPLALFGLVYVTRKETLRQVCERERKQNRKEHDVLLLLRPTERPRRRTVVLFLSKHYPNNVVCRFAVLLRAPRGVRCRGQTTPRQSKHCKRIPNVGPTKIGRVD
jgi:hypothetical protein